MISLYLLSADNLTKYSLKQAFILEIVLFIFFYFCHSEENTNFKLKEGRKIRFLANTKNTFNPENPLLITCGSLRDI